MGYIEKSIYGPMQSRLSYESIWLKIKFSQEHLVKLSDTKLKKKNVKGLMRYMEVSIYGLTQPTLSYGSIWLKIRIVRTFLVKV
jgi:hypothetical protein